MLTITETGWLVIILAGMNGNSCCQPNFPSEAVRHRLCVYISSECFSCQDAVLMTAEITRRFPQLLTEIINLDDPDSEKPDYVFAVPTYALDGKVISLGNPYREQMFARIKSALPDIGEIAP